MKRDLPKLPESPTDTFPYILEEKVGEGAMGAVYRALEPSLERTVALKVIHPKFLATLDDALCFEVTQRFIQEARAVDVVGGIFPGLNPEQRWESWISGLRCTARVEARRTIFPALTYRQQLKEAQLTVLKPQEQQDGRIVEDRVAAAASVQLVPQGKELGRGESTMQQLVHSDPTFQCMLYLVGPFALRMEQYRRAKPWRRLLAPLAGVETVVLHHAQPVRGGKHEKNQRCARNLGGTLRNGGDDDADAMAPASSELDQVDARQALDTLQSPVRKRSFSPNFHKRPNRSFQTSTQAPLREPPRFRSWPRNP